MDDLGAWVGWRVLMGAVAGVDILRGGCLRMS
jgi:hypothetical protein